MSYCYTLKIAGIFFRIHTKHPVSMTEAFFPFLRKNAAKAWDISFMPADKLPALPEKEIYRNQEYAVYKDRNGEYVRAYFDQMDEGRIYAAAMAKPKMRRTEIVYLPKKQKYFNEIGSSFFHIGAEQILACENRLILHASCVQTDLGGILFSGISGIGKSTQADLWRRFAGAELLNGDRPILGKKDGTWYAYGSPYAGSSKCYVDARCEIRAIVMLQKAFSCHIRKLAPGEAFRCLFAGTTVNSWDTGFVAGICGMESMLAHEIPVYELRCTPDRKAVKLLRDTLKGGG